MVFAEDESETCAGDDGKSGENDEACLQMTREEKVHDIANRMEELLRQPGIEMYQLPDEQHAVLIHGRINLLILAEWVLARMG